MFEDMRCRENIEKFLIERAHAVRVDSKGNLLSLAVITENFYREFLSLLLGCELINANMDNPNAPGIDLLDREKKIAVQVSITCSPERIRYKIRQSIQKFEKPDEEDWTFYFVPITDKAPNLKSGFLLPAGLLFDPKKDVLDIARILCLSESKGVDMLSKLSALVDRYRGREMLRGPLFEILKRVWEAHPSHKLMCADAIDQLLFPGIKDRKVHEAYGKRNNDVNENPVWTLIRETWKEPKNHPIVIQGNGGIGKTVSLFSLTQMDQNSIPAPALYVPMFDLVEDGKIINLSDYFIAFSAAYGKAICDLAAEPWNNGPNLLILLDGFNEIPTFLCWDAIAMLKKWAITNPGAQIIAVSRPLGNLDLSKELSEEAVAITLVPLSHDRVKSFLKEPPAEQSPLWETLVYPLFLTLYLKTENLEAQRLPNEYPLSVREPCAGGAIIWNYLQRELLRQSSEKWILRCAFACEFFAPIIAHHMVQHHRFTISQSEVLPLIRKRIQALDFECLPPHLANIIMTWKNGHNGNLPIIDNLDIEDAVLQECGLLAPYKNRNQSEKGQQVEELRYAFIHQSFRDCLAGCFFINEAEMAGHGVVPVAWRHALLPNVLDYTAELMNCETAKILWESNRQSQQWQQKHTSDHETTGTMLELWKKMGVPEEGLCFSGMDLRGLSLTSYVKALKLFQNSQNITKTILDSTVFRMQGHRNRIESVVAFPNGQVASMSSYETLVWNPNVGICLGDYPAQGSLGKRLTILADNRVVYDLLNGRLLIVDYKNKSAVRTRKQHKDFASCATELPDGRLVSGSYDCTLRVWNPDTGKSQQVLEGHSHWVRCVIALPDGRVVSGSDDNTIRVWNPDNGHCLQVLTGHSKPVSCVAMLTPKQIISSSWDCTLRVWDLEIGKCIQVLEGHSDSINFVKVLPNRFAISGADDRSLRVWNPATGECIHILNGHTGKVNSAEVLEDGMVVSGSWDYTIRTWDPRVGQCLQVLKGYSHILDSVAVLPDGRVASDSLDRTVHVWDPITGECLQVLGEEPKMAQRIIQFPEGGILIVFEDNSLLHWDPVTGRFGRTLRGHTARIRCANKISDGRIVSGSSDMTLKVWNITTGQCIHTLKGHAGEITCMANMGNGKIVSGSSDRTLRIWDTETGLCLHTLEGHSDIITCVAVTADGRVVSGSKDCSIQVWDVDTGKCLRRLKESDDSIESISVLPDGRIRSRTSVRVRYWNIDTGEGLKTRRIDEFIRVLREPVMISKVTFAAGKVTIKNSGFLSPKKRILFPLGMDLDLYGKDFSSAILSKDLAITLWQNGAKISSIDYARYIKPSLRLKKRNGKRKT